jgi:hypothetical protein
MAMPNQTDFFESIIDYIAETTDTASHGSAGGNRWVFRDPDSGKIVLNVDIWEWFDQNRSMVGETLLYVLIMGL